MPGFRGAGGVDDHGRTLLESADSLLGDYRRFVDMHVARSCQWRGDCPRRFGAVTASLEIRPAATDRKTSATTSSVMVISLRHRSQVGKFIMGSHAQRFVVRKPRGRRRLGARTPVSEGSQSSPTPYYAGPTDPASKRTRSNTSERSAAARTYYYSTPCLQGRREGSLMSTRRSGRRGSQPPAGGRTRKNIDTAASRRRERQRRDVVPRRLLQPHRGGAHRRLDREVTRWE